MKRGEKELIKSLTDVQQIKNTIKFLKDNNIFFKHTLTNYTTTIETPAEIMKWNTNNMDKRAFIANQMIKKDLREYTANEPPNTSAIGLQFFDTFIQKPITSDNVFCIDIKSAYAYVLLNDGFISLKTFNFLNMLPKKARLAALGMLASRQDVFYFQGSEMTGHIKNVNANESYFWYCVLRVSEIMKKIVSETKPLFFWVDGIYFDRYDDVIKCKQILTDEKYKFSEKKCLMFVAEMVTKKNSAQVNKISFYESKDLDLKYSDANKKNTDYKVFSIPLRTHIKHELINFLINK